MDIQEKIRRYLPKISDGPEKFQDLREYAQALKKFRIKLGLCIRCGSRLSYKSNLCESCHQIILRYRRRRYKRNAQKYRLLGLCFNCGGALEPGYKTCKKCREREKQFNDKKRSQGLCIICSKPIAKGRSQSRCAECLEKAKTWNRKRTKTCKDNKICRTCRNPVEEGHIFCSKCLAKGKELIARSKDKGICVTCRVRPAIPGRTHCEKCLERERKRRKRKAKINEEEQKYYGV